MISTNPATRPNLPGIGTRPKDSTPPSNPFDSFEPTPLPSADFETNKARLASLQDHRLWGLKSEKISNRDFSQTAMANQLMQDLGGMAKIHYQQDITRLNGPIPKLSELNQEFQKLAADPNIPFEYIRDGCYARAHVMCDTMNKDGIPSAKLFVMVDDPENTALSAKNRYMDAQWWYHVAPMCMASDADGQVKPYMMDPSVADHPIQPSEWVRKVWTQPCPIHLDITRQAQWGPAEQFGVTKTFEENLFVSQRINLAFAGELEKIKQESQHDPPGSGRAA